MHKKISLIFPNKIGISEQISIENSSELTHQSLKKEASEKFAIPEEKILLKVQRDGFLIRVTEQFPLSFYELQYGPEIIVENSEDILKIEEGEHSPHKSVSSPSREFKGCFDKRDPEKELMDKLIDLTAEGNLKAIKEFLSDKEGKQELFSELGSDGWNAIHVAVLKENEEIILYYLEKKGDFNIASTSGWTPLILAIFQNNIEIMKMILSLAHINVNQITLKGTALNVAIKKACDNNKKQMVKILMNADANPYLKDEEGNSAFDVCEDTEIASILNVNRYYGEIKDEKFLPKNTITVGFLYKIRNFLVSGGNERYYLLDPAKGQLIRYKTKQDYPNSPKEILFLKNIKYLQRIKPTWYMRKDLHYFEIVYDKKQVIGCRNVSTLKLWMNSICTATHYFNEQEKKKGKLGENSSFLEKAAAEISEIADILREEDKTSNFFRRNKVFPNQDLSTSFINRISRPRDNSSLIMQRPELKKGVSNDDYNMSMLDPESPSKSTLLRSNTTNFSNYEDAKVKFNSFDIIKLLGSGSFGKVFLVKKKNDGQLYAMKVLKKRDLILKKKLRYAITETKILKTCNHPFILQIYYSFQTPRNFYLVVDYCPRGDLSGELVKSGQFPEEVARFYIAELILAIEYLHKKNIIYRDLKPENMLIDVFGHMKLADFGLSKDGIGDDDRTKSFCGSPAYLSPEVLLAKNKNSKGYGKTADLYGIGAVLYEFIVGSPPYFSPEIPELFKKIKEGKLEFPKNVSPEARDLLKRLLEKEPEKRIGAKSKDEIKNHPFFKDFNWEKLYKREYDPPLDEYELTEQMFKPDKSLNFEDVDYEEKNIDHNRVPDYSFAKNAIDN